MKRLYVCLLVAAMSFSMTACGGETTEPTENGSTQSQETEAEEKGENREDIVFQEMTAVDNEECSIVLTELEPDSIWGYTVKARLENKSADKTYMFSLENASIDGVECSDLFAADVAPGKKANEEISLSDSELKENGVTDFSDIELSFRVYDSDDWMADPVARETVHIYPYGEENATVFVREDQPEDIVLVDNDEVTVIVTASEDDEIWGYSTKLFLVNKTDKNLMFSTDEASINGYMFTSLFASSVSAGKCEFTSMSWLDSEMEENGITEVEEIEMRLKVYDDENYTGDYLVDEVVTFSP